jgi:hypothetical protein
MPPDRYSGPPPPRPPRDRHAGPGFGGPRRSFGGPPGGGHGGPPRDAGRPPFVPRPAPAPAHSVRLREGDREVEVSGSPEFVRHTLDDLPNLLARLRGETVAPGRPASISMPPPPPLHGVDPHADDEPDEDDEEPEDEPPPRKAPRANGRVRHAGNGKGSLEDRVFDVLARADHPLSVATIRQQLGGVESGQQIRRILERASDRVYSTDERPAAYALR